MARPIRVTERSGRRKAAGFTYLWALMLIALMSLGMSIAADVYVVSVQREKERELLFIGQQFELALARYSEVPLPAQTPSGSSAVASVQPNPRPAVNGAAVESNFEPRRLPAELDELLEDKRVDPPARHLRRLYVDPITRNTEWGVVRFGGRIVGVHSLSTVTPLKTGGFDPQWATFGEATSHAEWVFSSSAGRELLTKAKDPDSP
jgi:hypothetical protein